VSTVEWFRVDDRLIHGQVLLGWVAALGIREVILANDRAADDSWMQDTLRTTVASFAEDARVEIRRLAEVVDYLKKALPRKRMLLVESPVEAASLYQRGLKAPRLILGGVHPRAGRVMLLSYLYLDSGEMDAILELSRKGIRIVAQDLPGSKAVDVVKLIKRKRSR